ncbi:Secretion-regulating guanine nucleotide exchange factor [Nymphon striatum]|nr:Secretion-regulating guanine nucleotide exchange factor [Nymphon striatum]
MFGPLKLDKMHINIRIAHVMLSGANTYGQLGHGHTTDLIKPTEMRAIESIDFLTVKRITGGGGHTIILTNQGEIYSCGWNNKGQLGIGISCSQLETFHVLKNSLNVNYVHVCCGWDFTLAISDSKKLHAWGSNEFKQLGIINVMNSPVSVVVEGLKAKNIIDIAAGLRHGLALTDDSEIWSWGTGRHGELGLTDADGNIIKQSAFPQKVSALENKKIKSIVCGANHSAALTFDGVLYVWGRNNKGQLGKDPVTLPISVLPQSISFDNSKIIHIKSGWTHMICITGGLDELLKEINQTGNFERKNGSGRPKTARIEQTIQDVEDRILSQEDNPYSKEVYIWGRSDYGQLGQDFKSISLYNYKKRKIFDHVDSIVIGAEHNLLIKDQKVWSWGWNEHGICGTGNEENVLNPQIIESLSIYHPIILGVGDGSSFVLVTESEKLV